MLAEGLIFVPIVKNSPKIDFLQAILYISNIINLHNTKTIDAFWLFMFLALTEIMSQDNMIKLECTECKTINYHSHKNKKTLKERLEMKKFCKVCRQHTLHKETK